MKHRWLYPQSKPTWMFLEGAGLLTIFPGKRIAGLDVNCHISEPRQSSLGFVIQRSVPGSMETIVIYKKNFSFCLQFSVFDKKNSWMKYAKDDDFFSLGKNGINNALLSIVLPSADVSH